MRDDADHGAIRAFFAEWGGYVAAVDFASARPLFDDGVIGFGTFMDTVVGLDNLERGQWRSIWPTIEDFRFNLDSLKCVVAPERLMAMGAITWNSTGIAENGERFDRPGRATVVFARADTAQPWRGVHTHFSLNPGTPQRSYGKRSQAGT